MSRVHTVTALAAVGLHLLFALPLLRHLSSGRQHRAPQVALEIPVEVVDPAPRRARARRQRSAAHPVATAAPVPAPVRLPVHFAPAQPKLAAPAAAPASPAPPPPDPSTTPAPTHAQPSEPSALGKLATTSLMGADANVLLLIHSAALRETSFGTELSRMLRQRDVLSAFFVTSDLDPLRDFDHFLLARSGPPSDAGASALLQYNVPRYRIRSAPLSLPDSAFALPVPQIVVVAHEAAAAAARVPRDFHLPEPAGDEAFQLYVKPPAIVALPTLPTLPASLRWLTLTLSADGSASVEFAAADSAAAIGRAPCSESDLRATMEALLDAAQ